MAVAVPVRALMAAAANKAAVAHPIFVLAELGSATVPSLQVAVAAALGE